MMIEEMGNSMLWDSSLCASCLFWVLTSEMNFDMLNCEAIRILNESQTPSRSNTVLLGKSSLLVNQRFSAIRRKLN